MKKLFIYLTLLFLTSCVDHSTNLNIVVTYNNGDVETFYNVACVDSIVLLTEGDVSVVLPGFENIKTLASNVRKYNLIK